HQWPHQRQVRAGVFRKPWRLAGGYAQSVQQTLSARSGGGLAAAWERGVQAGSARVTGYVFESLRNAGAAGDEVGAFRLCKGDEQLERSIEILRELIAKREAEANAKVSQGLRRRCPRSRVHRVRQGARCEGATEPTVALRLGLLTRSRLMSSRPEVRSAPPKV